jgi:hypothetical protein
VVQGFGAEAYGCQSLTGPATEAPAPDHGTPPPAGALIAGELAEVGGAIDANTTWAAQVIRVTDDVSVAHDASLTIAPGVRVEFAGHHRLLINGRLWAVGTAEARIQFLPAAGHELQGWDGIDFHNTPFLADWSRLEHCLLRGAVADSTGAVVGGPRIGGTHRPRTGGALSVVGGGRLAVAACEFVDNRADYGAAIYCGYGSSPVLAGNLFHGNSAVKRGSVLYNVYAFPKLLGNTLADNTCLHESAFEKCSAVDNFNGKVQFSGNIIRNNFTNHYTGWQFFECKPIYIRDNNIEAFSGGLGNLDLPGAFQGSGAHPYRLTALSPGLDQGPLSPWNALLADTDLAGDPRVAFGLRDMGAYEYNGVVAAAEDQAPAAAPLALRCVPNPFNPVTRLHFSLEETGQVRVRILDLRGRLVAQPAAGPFAAGHHTLDWDGRDQSGATVPAGVYTCLLETGRERAVVKLTLVR